MADKHELDLTIIIVNWNVTDKLKRCIDSVIDTCRDIHYEMFVIDNNSDDMDFDNIINKYSAHKQLIFIKNDKNEGGLVLNKIQDQIKGRYLLLLGPDVVLRKNAVRELINFMDTHKDAGAASGKLLNPDGSPQLYYYKFWDLPMAFYVSTTLGRIIDKILFSGRKARYYLGKDLDVNVNVPIEIEQPPAACLIIRPEVILEDGYLIDPNFPFYYNDVDICMRIWKRGYKIYLVPTAEVIHDHGSSFKKADPIWKLIEFRKSQIKYFRKYYPNKVLLLKTLVFLDSLLNMILYLFLIVVNRINPHHKHSSKSLIRKAKAALYVIRGVLRW